MGKIFNGPLLGHWSLLARGVRIFCAENGQQLLKTVGREKDKTVPRGGWLLNFYFPDKCDAELDLAFPDKGINDFCQFKILFGYAIGIVGRKEYLQ